MERWGAWSCANRLCERGCAGILQDQFTILELVAGEQQPQLIGRVDAAPALAQPLHGLEHQGEGRLPVAHPVGGVGM
jgi:hypothetical protein